MKRLLVVLLLSLTACSGSDEAEAFTVDRVEAGFQESCGLRGTELWCWGTDWQRKPPSRVFLGREVTDFAVGGGWICAVESGGAVRCQRYGYPVEGELVSGLPPMRQISDDGGGFCAIASGDGTPWCWGYSYPVRQVSSTLRLTSVSGGIALACGLDDEGAAWCWGRGTYGQLGDGLAIDSDVPVEVAGELRFRQVSAGQLQAACGIVDPAQLYCWGNEQPGRDIPASNVPRLVEGIAPTHVSVGFMGVLALENGTAWYWGQTYVPFPIRDLRTEPGLNNLPAVTMISAADDACVLDGNGAVYCDGEWEGDADYSWRQVAVPWTTDGD